MNLFTLNLLHFSFRERALEARYDSSFHLFYFIIGIKELYILDHLLSVISDL